jgi:lysophospholipid acyltransferase
MRMLTRMACSLAGPSFEYVYFKEFQDHTMFQKEGYRRSPSPYSAGMRTLWFSVLCYLVVLFSKFVPLHGFVDQPAFLEYPFIIRVLYSTLAVAIYRFKYYFVWYVAETACIMSGFGFNGCTRTGDEKVIKWDRHNNSSIAKVELGRTVPDLTNNWNKATNHWLKHCAFSIELPPCSGLMCDWF